VDIFVSVLSPTPTQIAFLDIKVILLGPGMSFSGRALTYHG
jgi:hypothetical protein